MKPTAPLVLAAVVLSHGLKSIQPSKPVETTASVVDTLVPGHPALRTVHVRIGTDTTETFTVANGARRKINTSIQSVAKTPTGYLVVQVAQSPGGEMIDSTWIDAGTFATRRHVEVGPMGSKSFAFAGRHVTGTRVDSGKTRTVDFMLDRDALDNSVGGLVMLGLPMTPGGSAVIATYDLSGDYNHATVRVVGDDAVPESSARGWKLVTDYKSGAREWSVNHWIDPDTRRDLRWELTIGNRSMFGVTK